MTAHSEHWRLYFGPYSWTRLAFAPLTIVCRCLDCVIVIHLQYIYIVIKLHIDIHFVQLQGCAGQPHGLRRRWRMVWVVASVILFLFVIGYCVLTVIDIDY